MASELDIYTASTEIGEIHHYSMETRIEKEFDSDFFDAAPGRPDDPDRTPYDMLWHDDGNIVLQAEGIPFRLHRSVLSYHSVVFRDMFSIGSRLVDGEIVDGCPVVDLSDSIYDLSHFLLPLYSGGSRYVKPTAHTGL